VRMRIAFRPRVAGRSAAKTPATMEPWPHG
jgi:hypothetical protein